VAEKQFPEEDDRKYIWHPFTQMKEWAEEDPIIITEGKDWLLRDSRGRWYIDGVSSLWVNIHGHRRKEIDDAIRAQLDKIAHTTLLGLSNVPAIELAERLIKIVQKCMGEDHSQEVTSKALPLSFPLVGNPSEERLRTSRSDGQYICHPHKSAPFSAPARVFYSDNGSTSVEVALKMAFQYWKHRGIEGRNSFLSLNNAYHGDTLGAVSVGGIDIFHSAFGPLLFKTFKAPSPYCYRCELGCEYPGCGLACLAGMEEVLREHRDEIAAVIIEPLIQAAGGMIVSPPGYLKGVRELCDRHEVLMIADEVATGFGRTGKMFACEHEKVVPDLLCLSKGITGGYLPLAVTVATEEIYEAFLGEYRDLKTFFHGHSYTGNPIACAAALACLDIFEKEDTIKIIQPKIELLHTRLEEMSALRHVGNVRNRGLMAGIELVKDRKTKEPFPWEEKAGWKVAYRARDEGLLIRPLGNVLVIMPPLSISLADLDRMLDIIARATDAVA
jgi:adenosylmethionine-8-amino-7-oxononanoate aminotransferase